MGRSRAAYVVRWAWCRTWLTTCFLLKSSRWRMTVKVAKGRLYTTALAARTTLLLATSALTAVSGCVSLAPRRTGVSKSPKITVLSQLAKSLKMAPCLVLHQLRRWHHDVTWCVQHIRRSHWSYTVRLVWNLHVVIVSLVNTDTTSTSSFRSSFTSVLCVVKNYTTLTRKPSWCWHTRATQKLWKKFLHFEVITSSSQVGNPVFIVIKCLIQITSTYNNS